MKFGDPQTLVGKIGRHASEEVILQIISSKCMPLLLHGLEACPLNKPHINSLDFVINRLFNFRLPSDILAQRSQKFLFKYRLCDNIFCQLL